MRPIREIVSESEEAPISFSCSRDRSSVIGGRNGKGRGISEEVEGER